jgi:L-seryl-tRNA(Ser) seleniumtransferase
LTLAALEAILLLYQKIDHISSIPVLRMINYTVEEVKLRAEACLSALEKVNKGMMILKIQKDVSNVGGGALPGESIPTYVIGFDKAMISVETLDRAFRDSCPAVVGRIQDATYKLDFRTISEDELPILIKLYERIVNELTS